MDLGIWNKNWGWNKIWKKKTACPDLLNCFLNMRKKQVGALGAFQNPYFCPTAHIPNSKFLVWNGFSTGLGQPCWRKYSNYCFPNWFRTHSLEDILWILAIQYWNLWNVGWRITFYWGINICRGCGIDKKMNHLRQKNWCWNKTWEKACLDLTSFVLNLGKNFRF